MAACCALAFCVACDPQAETTRWANSELSPRPWISPTDLRLEHASGGSLAAAHHIRIERTATPRSPPKTTGTLASSSTPLLDSDWFAQKWRALGLFLRVPSPRQQSRRAAWRQISRCLYSLWKHSIFSAVSSNRNDRSAGRCNRGGENQKLKKMMTAMSHAAVTKLSHQRRRRHSRRSYSVIKSADVLELELAYARLHSSE